MKCKDSKFTVLLIVIFVWILINLLGGFKSDDFTQILVSSGEEEDDTIVKKEKKVVVFFFFFFKLMMLSFRTSNPICSFVS